MYRIILALSIATFLLAWPMLPSAQPVTPSCEDRLAQAQTQLNLVQATRAQGEYVASDALAATQKKHDLLQARVQDLEKQLAEAQKAMPAAKKAQKP